MVDRSPKAFLACYLVLIRNNKILLSRRANTGFKDGYYSMIAGHLEGKETVWDAMVREAGLTLDLKGLKMLHILHRQDIDREYIDFFVLSDTTGEPKNLEPGKCDDISWFSLDKLPDDTIPYVRFAIENIKKSIGYSEYKVVA